MQSVVISCLDYCNILLNLCRKFRIWQRVLSSISLKEYISPLCFELPWLLLAARVKFKTLMLAYKVFFGTVHICLNAQRLISQCGHIQGFSASSANTTAETIWIFFMCHSIEMELPKRCHSKTAGLQLNDEKYHFNQTCLHFIGHTISVQGLKPNTLMYFRFISMYFAQTLTL